ncbi:quinone zinc-dependent oxidoreductase [Rhodoferax antarcticus ANT.BR]|uniref:Quinone zinc-dependent oxidoreductase n=2 Tax=Rhodoferax antarcticus TaxID=81479 RepID=A0A1Q8YCK3_9BURK|nr:quinone zinc-dependent oxidoreductase [Rhodoferax antarcticus ANT.BR]
MQLTEFGGPEKLVYRTDLAVPEPLAGEVMVQVGACGINNTDIWTREGAYGAGAEGGWRGSDFDPSGQGAFSGCLGHGRHRLPRRPKSGADDLTAIGPAHG